MSDHQRSTSATREASRRTIGGAPPPQAMASMVNGLYVITDTADGLLWRWAVYSGFGVWNVGGNPLAVSDEFKSYNEALADGEAAAMEIDFTPKATARVASEDVGEWCPMCGADDEIEWYSGSPRCLVCDASWVNAEELGFDQNDYARVAKDSKPYGDVEYADPGYQSDGKSRYPIDTAEHVRAAWSYINQSDNAAKYDSGQVSSIKSKIKSKAKELSVEIKSASRKTAVAECPDCGSTDVRERPDGEYKCKACDRVFEGSRTASRTAGLDWEDDGDGFYFTDGSWVDEGTHVTIIELKLFEADGGWQYNYTTFDEDGHEVGEYESTGPGAYTSLEEAKAGAERSIGDLRKVSSKSASAHSRIASRRQATEAGDQAFCWGCNKIVWGGKSGQPCSDCGEPMSPISEQEAAAAEARGEVAVADRHCAGSEEWHLSPGRTASMTTCSSCGWRIWPTYWRPGIGGYLPPHTSTIDGKTADADGPSDRWDSTTPSSEWQFVSKSWGPTGDSWTRTFDTDRGQAVMNVGYWSDSSWVISATLNGGDMGLGGGNRQTSATPAAAMRKADKLIDSGDCKFYNHISY